VDVDVVHLSGPVIDVSVIRTARPPAPVMSVVKVPMVFAVARAPDAATYVASLVRAARHLPWPVFIAGPEIACDPAARAVGDASDALSAVDRESVHCTGALSTREIAPMYAAAAICALPARDEPSGLSVREAAQVGCALVLGDLPSLRELWQGAAVCGGSGRTGCTDDRPLPAHTRRRPSGASCPRRAGSRGLALPRSLRARVRSRLSHPHGRHGESL
jgi:hypothetical protein